MTVPASDRLSQLYTGNGVNTRFDFTFRVFDQEDATGIAVKVDLGTEFETMDESLYQVTINQDNLGGYVVFNTAPSNQTSFYIAGETPVDQALDITNYDNFYPDSIEKSLDKLTAILQEWSHLLGFEEQARKLSGIKYDQEAQARENQIKNELQSNIDYIDQNTSAMLQEAIANGTVSALAVTTVNTVEDLNTLIKWDGRTVAVAGIGNYKYSASTNTWSRDFITDRQVITVTQITDLDNTVKWDGRTVTFKSRVAPNYALKTPFSGGGTATYDSSRASENDGGLVWNGWVRKWNKQDVNVDWFGADPTGNLDSTTAALNAVKAITGRVTSPYVSKTNYLTLVFGMGLYKIGDLPLVSGVRYVGMGALSTQIIPSDTATWVFKTVDSTEANGIVTADRLIYTYLEDMTIGYGYVNQLPISNQNAGGVFIQAASWCRFKNVSICGIGNIGLKLLGVFDTDFDDMYMFRCGYEKQAPALYIDRFENSGDGTNASTFRRLHIEGCYQHFYIGKNTRHLWFEWSKFEQQTVSSIIEDNQGVTFNSLECSISATSVPWLIINSTSTYSPFVVQFNNPSFIGAGWYLQNNTNFKVLINGGVGRRVWKLASGKNFIIDNFYAYDCGSQLLNLASSIVRDCTFDACKTSATTDGTQDLIVLNDSNCRISDCDFNAQGSATDGLAFINILNGTKSTVKDCNFGAGRQYGIRGDSSESQRNNTAVNTMFSGAGSPYRNLLNKNNNGLGVGNINSANAAISQDATVQFTLAGGSSLIFVRGVNGSCSALLFADSNASLNLISKTGSVDIVANATGATGDGKIYIRKTGSNIFIENRTASASTFYLMSQSCV